MRIKKKIERLTQALSKIGKYKNIDREELERLGLGEVYDILETLIKQDIEATALEQQQKLKVVEEAKKPNGLAIDLNKKIDDFIDWCSDNEYGNPEQVRKFIEKMAYWYEARYPEYGIAKEFNLCHEEKDINEIMFQKNPYIDTVFDKEDAVRQIDWADFYNAHAFISSLPWDEKRFLTRPKYCHYNPIYTDGQWVTLYLTSNGFVERTEDVTIWTHSAIKDEELKGLNIKDVVKLFKERNISPAKTKKIEKLIEVNEAQKYRKEEILNCVMYRIIENGGNREGPRRAFLFAKEFNRNIDVPMMYGADLSDPQTRNFINDYLKAGGSPDLECYLDYFYRNRRDEELDIITVRELLRRKRNYTQEERPLHQRLVDALASQVDEEAVRQEEIKRKRIQRKLQKSRRASQQD